MSKKAPTKKPVDVQNEPDDVFVVASIAAPIYAIRRYLAPHNTEDPSIFYDMAIEEALELMYRVAKVAEKVAADARQEGST